MRAAIGSKPTAAPVTRAIIIFRNMLTPLGGSLPKRQVQLRNYSNRRPLIRAWAWPSAGFILRARIRRRAACRSARRAGVHDSKARRIRRGPERPHGVQTEHRTPSRSRIPGHDARRVRSVRRRGMECSHADMSLSASCPSPTHALALGTADVPAQGPPTEGDSKCASLRDVV